MDDKQTTPGILGEALLNEIEGAVHRAVERVYGNGHHEKDQLLNAKAAAKVLSVSEYWLYDHADTLPFTRRLAPNVLRFSSNGIQKWIATRKPGRPS